MKQEKEIKFAGTSGLRVEIKLSTAGIHIIGNDEHEPQVKVSMERITSPREDENITDHIDITYNESTNMLHIIQKDRQSKNIFKSLRLELIIPQKSEISCISTNGGIKVENIEFDQDYKLTNGGVKAIACKSRLEVRSTNGGIKILNHEGELDLVQTNGGISILDSRGDIKLKNHNGGVKLNHCHGMLVLDHMNGAIKALSCGFSRAAINTMNSNIYYEFEESIDSGNFNFANKHGKIQVIIPQELPYNIKAESKHGKVMIGLDKAYTKTGENSKEFSLVNGAGAVKIDISNDHGSILLLDEMHKHTDVESKISRKIEVILKDKIIPTLENLTADNAPKIQKKIRKAGEALSKIEIDVPEIEKKIKTVIAQISDSVTETIDDNAEDIEKYKKSAINSVNQFSENITGLFSGKKQTDTDKDETSISPDYSSKAGNKSTVNERSRLKILELLEKGTITPDQAEKLLNAINSDGE